MVATPLINPNMTTNPSSSPVPSVLSTEADYQAAIRQLEARLAEATAQRDQSLRAAYTATAAVETASRQPTESDRAVAKLIRDKLRPFTGRNRTPHNIRNFLAQFSLYADYAKLDQAARVVAVGALLADEAAAWYQSLAGRISSFVEFRRLFLHRWGDPLEEENARRKLATIRQTGPVRLYTEEFRRIVLLLPDLTEADMFFAYKQGLNDGLQRDLRVMRVTSLEEAISTAEELDEIDRQRRRGTGRPQGHPQGGQARRPEPNGPTPMELGAVAAKPSPTPTTANYNDFQLFPRLTDSLREFLKARNACLYCRAWNADHQASACPKKRKIGNGPKN